MERPLQTRRMSKAKSLAELRSTRRGEEIVRNRRANMTPAERERYESSKRQNVSELIQTFKNKRPEINIINRGITKNIGTSREKITVENRLYMYNDFIIESEESSDYIKDKEKSKNFKLIKFGSENQYKLVQSNQQDISYKGYILDSNQDAITIVKNMGRDTYNFNYNKFVFENNEFKSKQTTISNVIGISSNEINISSRPSNPHPNNIYLDHIKEHFEARVFYNIITYVDIKLGYIQNEQIRGFVSGYDKIKMTLAFIYNNLNKYISLPFNNNSLLLHFYIAVYLIKALITPEYTPHFTLVNDMQQDILSGNLEIIKYVYAICNRLLKYSYIDFEKTITIHTTVNVMKPNKNGVQRKVTVPKKENKNINITQRIFEYASFVINIMKSFICTPLESNRLPVTSENIIRLIGYDICEGNNLATIILKKILNEEITIEDFTTYIDNINGKNIRNKKNLFKIIIYYINFYFDGDEYEGIIPNKLKIPQELRYTLFYNPNRLNGRENALDDFSQNLLSSSKEECVNNVVHNLMINDHILAKILYFYYLTFKPKDLCNELEADPTKGDNIFLTNILEYQFYLCHILRKKLEDTLYRNQDNYYKASVFLRKYSPHTYKILFNHYHSVPNSPEITMLEFKCNPTTNITFFNSNTLRNESDQYMVYNVGKIINFINIENTKIIANSGAIENFVELKFIRCYREINRLSTNFTNFNFLNNNTILTQPIYENISGIYNLGYFTEYLNSRPQDYLQKSKNIFKLMPYVLFYYYKAIVEAGAGARTRARTGVREAREDGGETYISSLNIMEFLNFSLELFKVYDYIIRGHNRTNLLNYETNNDINDIVYKINKIMYKTIKDLVNQLLLRSDTSFIPIIIEINNIKRELIPIYENKHININNYNYAKSMIPNFNEQNILKTYNSIENEQISINAVIRELGPANLSEKLVPKYNMIKRREIPLNVKGIENVNHNLLNKHNDNHILLRKLLNNYNKPLNKYHNYIIKRKI